MKPHRIRMAHNLVLNYGLYKHMEIYVGVCRPATCFVWPVARGPLCLSAVCGALPFWHLNNNCQPAICVVALVAGLPACFHTADRLFGLPQQLP